jgi:hypothetical protein
MSHLRCVEGGEEVPLTERSLASTFHSPHDFRFGPPPSLLAGTITSVLGVGASLVSLVLFFWLWQPEPYISQQWLIFAVAGAIIGFFMRLEQPIVEVFSQIRTEEPD